MTTKDMQINRDTEHDILYVIKIGVDPKTTTNVIVSADVTLRRNKAGEVVGFIIDDFSKVFSDWNDYNEYELMEEFDHIMNVLNDKCARDLTSQSTPAASSASSSTS
mgnify:CR=1 FL=1